MVRHILKNGKEVKDIKGHLIKRKDAPRVYEILEQKGDSNDQRIIGHIKY